MNNPFFQKDHLTLILTLRCNLDCSFCSGVKSRISMDPETARRAVDLFLPLEGKRKTIKFFGGEPLLEFGLLKETVIYAEKKGKELDKDLKFTITTNGILLTAGILAFFKEHGIELVMSSHHLHHISKKILALARKLPQMCLNIDIFPGTAGTLSSRFIRYHREQFNRFNLLPLYYVPWKDKEIRDLNTELEKIKDHLFQHPEIQLANQEARGEIPLYNSCYTADPEGNIYSSNIILSRQFSGQKELFLLKDRKGRDTEKGFRTSLRPVVMKNLDKKTLKSTFRTDKALSHFIENAETQRPLKRADIKVGYSCNNLCKFCVQGRKRDLLLDKTTDKLKRVLSEARRTCQQIVFTGGEPTVRPDFLELAAYARSLGFKRIQVQSNGRMFAYKRFCREAVDAGVNEFGLALHGHIPELHNYLTSSEAFHETVQGFRNLKALGQSVFSNTVITKSNYRHLPEISRLLVSLKADQFQFAFVHALGSAQQNFFSVVPRMSMVIPYVKKGLDTGERAGVRGMTEAIPYCLMAGYEQYIAERFIPSTEIYEFNVKVEFDKVRPVLAKKKGKECRTCRYDRICEGTWREYPARYGFSEFKPVTGASHE
ncbi:MAG: radical SAM protein [bacterium]|nr:radical SAM protein [bacterium]